MAVSAESAARPEKRLGPVIAACTLLGIGMGGFVDGIVLHQILQWHNMISHRLPPDTLLNSKTNMFWDGMFHAFTWMVTLIGLILLWNALKDRTTTLSNRILFGGLLFGWGLFNIVEGIIDHHLLVLHQVREVSTNPPVWNYGFLGFSLLILILGWRLIQQGRKYSW
jgi:uncharacterized membrane protein